MARTVRNIEAHGSTSFDISVYGLNVNTDLNVYFNNNKVSSDRLTPRSGRAGDQISTNDNGEAHFIFFIPSATDTTSRSEAKYFEFLESRAGRRDLIVVDKASIDDSSLPSNFRNIARCYAETFVDKEFSVTFTEVKDWGDLGYEYDTNLTKGNEFNRTFG